MPFTLQQETLIPEINSTARLFRHNKTGARLFSLTNTDENKSFGITFRTIPASSNGIAHIMEHSVLCGSRKYRVKEPFVELVKGSMKTFLNAMTFPDRTCYPVASTNLHDFYNLIDVYLDAVFYPLLDEHTLRQEGWHYELPSLDAPLTIKGVVYNEMKGIYSSPDSLIDYEYSRRSLFPDTAYGFDSGGHPANIPELSYPEFLTFHERYYHPSNAFIWFSGDDPEPERLRILDAWLESFDARAIPAQVSLQPVWDSARQVEYRYHSGNSPDSKSYITVNWLLPEINDTQTQLGFSILSHILTGTPAAPLRKGLLDSGLGDDLAGAGFEDGLRQGFYSVGLKGVETANLSKVELLILEILTDLAKLGLDRDTITAAMNTFEFRLREQNTGQFPRGLALMFAALSNWIYGENPIEVLAFEASLDSIKTLIADGEPYFEQLIKNHLLLNPHRSTVTLVPDPQEGRRIEQAERARLESVKAGMSPSELQAVMDGAEELRRLQNTPDSPESLAALPYLKLTDLDREGKTIPISILDTPGSDENGGPQIIFHDLPTNGIFYLDLGFNLRTLPAELLPIAGIFGRLLLEMGTGKEDYVRLTQRIGRETGGIRPSSLTSALALGNGSATDGANGDSALWFFLRAKSVVPKSNSLFSILEDVLLSPALENRERFRQIVHEEKSGLEAALIPSGHGYIHSRLQARLCESGWVSEQLGGIAQLQFLRDLATELEADWPAVLTRLGAVRDLLINRDAIVANITTDSNSWQGIAPKVKSFLGVIPSSSPQLHAYSPDKNGIGEGLSIPAQVNYVGEGFSLYPSGYQLHGSALVASRYLRATYMWDKIRVQGGAYGGYSLFDPHSGIFSFLSYRDPNLIATLDAYRAAPAFLQSLEISESELTRSIIGTISDLDTYLLPDAKGWISMTRHLIGYNDTLRQRIREQVLETSSADIRDFGSALAIAARQTELVVLGSAEAIAQANQDRPGLLTTTKVL